MQKLIERSMKSGSNIFEDAFALHQQHPLTFQIPTQAQLRQIREGDLVKVAARAERFWLNVTKAEFPNFEGTVDNDLLFAEEIGMDYGDGVSFEARHIYNIKTVAEQERAEKADGDPPTISLDLLEGELPPEAAVQCALDNQTYLLIGRVTSAVMVTVILHGAAVGSVANLERLNAAANELGFVPDAFRETMMSGVATLILTLPLDVDGPELLKRVRAAVAAVHAEARRLLASEPKDVPAAGTNGCNVAPADNRAITLPPWVVESCPQCMHGVRMGYPIPDEEVTPAIFDLLCPSCRLSLPFDKQGCPISRQQLTELCDYVEEQLASRRGDDTLRFAGEFCDREHLPKDATLAWLRSQGGYCDIEVALNVATRWSE